MYGRIVFGGSAVLLGIISLMWHDADTWQTLRRIWSLPLGAVIGGCLMSLQIAGGVGIQYPRTAQGASLVLGVVYFLFSLACVPDIMAAPAVYEHYGSFFEQFSALSGAIALYGATEVNAARALAFGRVAFALDSDYPSRVIYAKPGSSTSPMTAAQLGSNLDSAKSEILGHADDDRVCTRGNRHSHQSPGSPLHYA